MARKPFATTLEENVAVQFKEECKNSGINMNLVMEVLMQGFINHSFVLTLKDGKFVINTKAESEFQNIFLEAEKAEAALSDSVVVLTTLP